MYKLTKTEWAWAMYDFANSAYAFIVLSLFFPLFFADYIAVHKPIAALWALSLAVSIIIVGFFSPLLGAYTDRTATRKRYFIFTSLFSVIGTAILFTTAYMPWLIAVFTFIIINAAFGLSRSLFDSFITVISPGKNVSTTLSGLSCSMGYIGGPLCLLIVWLMIGQKWPGNLSDYRLVFLTTGLFFLIFSLWTYVSLPRDEQGKSASFKKHTFQMVWHTLHKWKTMKHIFIFLFAMYFIVSGTTTIIYFISLFAKTHLQFNIGQIVYLLLIVQGVGIFATVGICWLAEKYGELKFLIICTGLWILIIFLMFISHDYTSFLSIAALSGIVLGSTPAIARGFFGKIIPVDQRAEFYGFNTLVSRVAAIIGPLVFGFTSSLWDMRIALLTIIPFLLTAVVLLIYLSNKNEEWQKTFG